MDDLIQRIRQHKAQADDGDDDYLPASLETVQQAEAELGFALPSLLRELYLQVGNGGFGPGYGIIGIAGGATDENASVVDLYLLNRRTDPDPFWRWPEGLLPLCHWGCAIYSCLDCSDAAAPVVVFDPNQHEYDEGGTPRPWDSSFFVHMPSFSAWLAAWLDGVDLWAGTRRRAA